MAFVGLAWAFNLLVVCSNRTRSTSKNKGLYREPNEPFLFPRHAALLAADRAISHDQTGLARVSASLEEASAKVVIAWPFQVKSGTIGAS